MNLDGKTSYDARDGESRRTRGWIIDPLGEVAIGRLETTGRSPQEASTTLNRAHGTQSWCYVSAKPEDCTDKVLPRKTSLGSNLGYMLGICCFSNSIMEQLPLKCCSTKVPRLPATILDFFAGVCKRLPSWKAGGLNDQLAPIVKDMKKSKHIN